MVWRQDLVSSDRAATSGQLNQILSQNTLHHSAQGLPYLSAQVRAAEHIQNGIENTV